jgi:uncharacterized membrane protein YphA (DoxX/SURF4 family)
MNTSLQKTIVIVVRFASGLLFLLSGIFKLGIFGDFTVTVLENLRSMGVTDSTEAGFMVAILAGFVIFAEIALSVSLFTGKLLRFAIPAGILLLIIFIVTNINNIINESSGSCDCFGEALPLSYDTMLIVDLILLIIFILLMKYEQTVESQKNNFTERNMYADRKEEI